jgi:hypothetical protein
VDRVSREVPEFWNFRAKFGGGVSSLVVGCRRPVASGQLPICSKGLVLNEAGSPHQLRVLPSSHAVRNKPVEQAVYCSAFTYTYAIVFTCERPKFMEVGKAQRRVSISVRTSSDAFSALYVGRGGMKQAPRT